MHTITDSVVTLWGFQVAKCKNSAGLLSFVKRLSIARTFESKTEASYFFHFTFMYVFSCGKNIAVAYHSSVVVCEGRMQTIHLNISCIICNMKSFFFKCHPLTNFLYIVFRLPPISFCGPREQGFISSVHCSYGGIFSYEYNLLKVILLENTECGCFVLFQIQNKMILSCIFY